MPRRFNVVGLSIALLLLLTACGVTSGPTTGAPIASTAVTPVATPTATPPSARCTAPGSPVAGGGVSPQFDLYGIAAVSLSEAWAVGTDGTDGVILHLICGAGTPAFRHGAEAPSPLCGRLVLCVRHSDARQSNGFSTPPARRTPDCTVSLRRCSGREPGSGPRGRTGSVVTPPLKPCPWTA